MPEIVTMPKLGFDMAEGTLVRWVKAEGDQIAKGDVLAEIETDKATVEVDSNYEGVMYRQLVGQDTVVPVGTPIAVIAAPGEKVSDEEIAAATGGEQAEAPQEKQAPAPQPQPQQQEAQQPQPPSQAPGAERYEGGTAVAEAEPVEQPAEEEGMVRASPLAKRMAEEEGLSLSQIQGSGPQGRVVKRDVEEALAARKQAPAAKPTAPAAAPAQAAAKAPVPQIPLPSWQPGAAIPNDQTVPLSKLRQAIGRRMVELRQQVPHFYVTHEYDFGPIMKLRKQINNLLPEDQKISVNDFIIKAVAIGLRYYPGLNASIQGANVIRHGHVNIGVAVAVENGLLTVVVSDADQKPLRLISTEVREMVERVRSGKVRSEDIEGSTFSISNLGMFDVEEFVAIINPPEAAILAIGSVKQVPVVQDGAVQVGTRMKMTLSADHRITDGAEGARFMKSLEDFLEHPLTLLV